MTVDVVILIVFLVLVYLGWRSGALSQTLRIAAAVAVIFGSPYVAPFAREAMFGRADVATPLVEAGSLFVAGLAIYLAVSVSGWLAVRTLRATSRTLSTMDRAAGAGIGAVKASLLIYFLVAGLLFLMVPLEKTDPDDTLHLRDGEATQVVEQYDVIAPWRFPRLVRLRQFLEVGAALEDRDVDVILGGAGEAADLFTRDDVEKLLDDDALMKAVEAKRYARLVADPRVRSLVNDGDFWKKADDYDWAGMLSRAEDAPEVSRPSHDVDAGDAGADED